MKTIAIVATLSLLCVSAAQANGHRVYYGGGHHTASHGGHYGGAYSGSSHKGGHYKNVRTSNHYGRHKR